ncbi:MAG: hypothetical protein IPK17_37390 [Chloroflexi bacterium]|uniref:hypothetical protein n=1 Tax=Candidatus Flexifilum breve TaxID=3140694 RepID=UPI00313480D3|nr:hypothetical protein [Chloroflexota bacterium]
MTEGPVRILRIIARLEHRRARRFTIAAHQKLGARPFITALVCGNIEAGEGDMRYFAEKHGVTPLLLPELGRSLNPCAT